MCLLPTLERKGTSSSPSPQKTRHGFVPLFWPVSYFFFSFVFFFNPERMWHDRRGYKSFSIEVLCQLHILVMGQRVYFVLPN